MIAEWSTLVICNINNMTGGPAIGCKHIERETGEVGMSTQKIEQLVGFVCAQITGVVAGELNDFRGDKAVKTDGMRC